MIIIEEEDKRFYIAPSTIPGAGNGLFAKELIPKGEFLEVIGVMVRNGSPADQSTAYANDYKFAAKIDNYTCKIIPLGYGGIVNHTNNRLIQNAMLSYSLNPNKRSVHAGQIRYEAIRDIYIGEEILGYYGDDRDKEIQIKNDWDKFLSHNLYGLGALKIKE